MQGIYKKFYETVKKNSLIKKNDKILIGFSGGPDSTALALLLKRFSLYENTKITLAYLNHLLREDSMEEEEMVKKISEKLSLPLIVKRTRIKEIIPKGENLEAFSRKVRYEFLKDTLKKINYKKIATAHTLDDLVETFFIKLLRGSGFSGLKSILPARESLIIRPLIEIEKSEIIEYLKGLNFDYVEDSENYNLNYTRNRVRHILIPLIMETFNPSIKNVIYDTVKIIRKEDEYLRRTAEKVLKRVKLKDGIDVKKVKKLHPAIKRRVVLLFLKEIMKNELYSPKFKTIEALEELKEGKIYELPSLKLIVEGGILKKYEKRVPPEEEIIIQKKELPKMFNFSKFKVKVSFFDIQKNKPLFDDKKRAYIKVDEKTFPIKVRRKLPGDRYTPLGLNHRKKLKKVFMEKKVPPSLREIIPVFLSSSDEIIWAPYIPINEKFKIKNTEKNILFIEVEERF